MTRDSPPARSHNRAHLAGGLSGLPLLLCLLTTLAAAQGGAPATQAPSDTGVPVVYRGREVFRIYRGVGNLGAAERARLASEHLGQLVNDLSFDPTRVTVNHGETYSELVHDDRVLGVITDEDAKAAGRPRAEYAQQARDRLVEVVTTTREEFSPGAIAVGLAWAALATLILMVLLRLLTRLARRVHARVDAWYKRLTADPRIGKAAARRAKRVGLVHSTIHLATAAVAVALVAVWVQVVLQVLPWSRPLAQQIFRYVAEPIRVVWLGFLGVVPNLFYLAVIALIALLVLRLVHIVFREIADGNIRLASFPDEWADPTYKLVRVLLLAVALVAAFPYIPGAQSPAFQGISLFLGLLVSLASSSALSNIIAGTILTYTRAFRLGDLVRIGETMGQVTDRRLLVTRVQTPKNEIVSIPNSLILTTQVLNYTTLAAERGLIAHTSVTIGYDAPWRKVHELLIAAALRVEGVLQDPPPFVLETALNDFSVSYEVNFFVGPALVSSPLLLLNTYSAVHVNIQECFNEAGVEIMSPNYFALRDGNQVTTPRTHLPPDYEPPAFRVRHREEPDHADTGNTTKHVSGRDVRIAEVTKSTTGPGEGA
jgi:small-conductance mechanosensitive channel